MKVQILKCNKCNIYTLNNKCPNCSSITITNKPARFSLEDKYGEYRRKYKDEVGN